MVQEFLSLKGKAAGGAAEVPVISVRGAAEAKEGRRGAGAAAGGKAEGGMNGGVPKSTETTYVFPWKTLVVILMRCIYHLN